MEWTERDETALAIGRRILDLIGTPSRIQFSRCRNEDWTTFNVRNEDADEVARRLLGEIGE